MCSENRYVILVPIPQVYHYWGKYLSPLSTWWSCNLEEQNKIVNGLYWNYFEYCGKWIQSMTTNMTLLFIKDPLATCSITFCSFYMFLKFDFPFKEQCNTNDFRPSLRRGRILTCLCVHAIIWFNYVTSFDWCTQVILLRLFSYWSTQYRFLGVIHSFVFCLLKSYNLTQESTTEFIINIKESNKLQLESEIRAWKLI